MPPCRCVEHDGPYRATGFYHPAVGISSHIGQDPRMILFRPMTDTEPSLTCSPLLRATLLTFDYIETNGPISLTAGKALKRYFVEWAAKAFDWPHYAPDYLYAVNKVLNEVDYLPLTILHDLLLSAKLTRHYQGTMRLTKLARDLNPDFPDGLLRSCTPTPDKVINSVCCLGSGEWRCRT